jgi:hypothetical protein
VYWREESTLLVEVGTAAIEKCRSFVEEWIGKDNVEKDSIDVTLSLLTWANRTRGFEVSLYRAQVWECIVQVVDAALWIGWLYPRGDNQ